MFSQTNTQKWEKLGLIIKPDARYGWMKTHAMVPVVQARQGDVHRVYFSGRDDHNRSLIGYADIDLKDPCKILRVSPHPVLGLGELGCFDDNGVTPSWIVEHQGRTFLYYIGWNQKSTVRMSLVAGLAVSDDDGESFQRVLRVPILERTHQEPYLLNTGPCVLMEGNVWRMWYVSGVGWDNPDLPRYNIKYAESKDGVSWERKGIVCIDFQSKAEHAIARPCVIKEDGKYKMWYSYKGEQYRIGYAESKDGISWIRMDGMVAIDVSAQGWDSQMIEYAFVLRHKTRKHMFYNGNDYGKKGIGYAVMEDA